jgi:hypothetical protein
LCFVVVCFAFNALQIQLGAIRRCQTCRKHTLSANFGGPPISQILSSRAPPCNLRTCTLRINVVYGPFVRERVVCALCHVSIILGPPTLIGISRKSARTVGRLGRLVVRLGKRTRREDPKVLAIRSRPGTIQNLYVLLKIMNVHCCSQLIRIRAHPSELYVFGSYSLEKGGHTR